MTTYNDTDWIALLRDGLKPSRRREEGRVPTAADVQGSYAFGVATDAAEKIDHTRPATVPPSP